MKTATEHTRENESKWNRRSRTYDSKMFSYFRIMQKMAINRIRINEGMHFLDIGCGTGWAVKEVARLADGNGQFWGVDLAEGMIAKAKKPTQRIIPVHFVKANAENLPFDPDYFDAILCTNSFHHYLHPNQVLNEVFRVLQPNGRLYILDVTTDNLLMYWVNRNIQHMEKAHVSFYSTKQYKEMFSQSGLRHLRSQCLLYPLKLHLATK